MCCGWAATPIARESCIVAAFEEQKSTTEIADTLKTLYHGGNGVGSITAWYAEDGIHLSHGKTAVTISPPRSFPGRVPLSVPASFCRTASLPPMWSWLRLRAMNAPSSRKSSGICTTIQRGSQRSWVSAHPFQQSGARFPGGICMAHRTAEKPGVSPEPCGRICCLLDGLPAGSGFAALPLP